MDVRNACIRGLFFQLGPPCRPSPLAASIAPSPPPSDTEPDSNCSGGGKDKGGKDKGGKDKGLEKLPLTPSLREMSGSNMLPLRPWKPGPAPELFKSPCGETCRHCCGAFGGRFEVQIKPPGGDRLFSEGPYKTYSQALGDMVNITMRMPVGSWIRVRDRCLAKMPPVGLSKDEEERIEPIVEES